MEGIFSHVIRGKRDVTDSYLTHEGGIVVDAKAAMDKIHPAIARVRQYLEDYIPKYPNSQEEYREKKDGLLIDMQTISESCAIERDTLFAIDGTPATPHMHYSTAQVFAAAVMGISYKNLERPHTLLATTMPQFLDDAVDLCSFEAVVEWAKRFDSIGTNQSWPSTFLEFIEREYAIQQQKLFTLIDGPICTQNLITQDLGRQLLHKFFDTLSLTCGVIKSIQSSTSVHRLFARALHPGEALLIEPSKQLVERRNEKRHVQWLDRFFQHLEETGVFLWRGVYRPGAKAFGFECDIRYLDQVIAMLWQERDVFHVGHEIPFLLNQVDAHLRSSYNAMSYKDHLTYTLGMDLGDDELFDEMDERDFR